MSRLLGALAGDPEIEALLSDEAQVAAILRFEIALAEAEAEVGLIAEASADAIVEAAAGFTPDWDDLVTGIGRDGVVVPALISQLRGAVPAPHRGDLHRGATSQDAIDTALMLQLSTILPILDRRLTGLRTQLEALSLQSGGNTLMAHTRMQAAMPFTVADKLRTWDEGLRRHQEALARMTQELVIQLGGPIGDRSSFDGRGGEVAASLARRLGLGDTAPWHPVRDRVVGLGGLLAMIAGSMGKLGADIALMAQTEVGAAVLADGGKSSSMSHKNNPVGAEILVALAHYAAGLSGTLNHAMVHENERSGSAWTLEWLTLPPLIVAAGASLRRAQALLGSVARLGDER